MSHYALVKVVKEPLNCVKEVKTRRMLDVGGSKVVWNKRLPAFDGNVIWKTPFVEDFFANLPIVVEEYLGPEVPQCLALSVRRLSVEVRAPSLPIHNVQEETPLRWFFDSAI